MGVLKIVVSLRWAESNGPNSYLEVVRASVNTASSVFFISPQPLAIPTPPAGSHCPNVRYMLILSALLLRRIMV